LKAAADRVFFTAADIDHGRELWSSDGTADGTRLVHDFVPGQRGASFEEFTPVGERMFFSAFSSVYGEELWVSDGTAAGTRVACDIAPGSGSSAPRLVTLAGDLLFFTAVTARFGRQLWVLPLATDIVDADFRRGDVNADGDQDVADAIFLLNFLFAGRAGPPCLDAADANDGGSVNIADAVAILSHLFRDGGALPEPFEACGGDPTADPVDCAAYGPCD
jgi:ELWxxDGT repeat protein